MADHEERAAFGQRLTAALERVGGKRADIAVTLLGVDPSRLSSWANGRSFPDYLNLKLLHDKLDVTYAYLFGEEDLSEPATPAARGALDADRAAGAEEAAKQLRARPRQARRSGHDRRA